MQFASLKLSRTWINIFFVYAGFVTLVNGLIMVRVSRNWILSNWLVNYQGGFVRRGLPGEVFYWLGHLLHISPVFFVVSSYLLLYVAFFWTARELVLASSRNLWVMALLLSPATLSFQVLHPKSGFGKELIHIAALGLMLLLLKRGKLSATGAAVFLTVVVLIGTLSHEGNYFYAPYFFAGLMLGGRSFWQAVKECAIPAVVGFCALYACTTHIGSVPIATAICSSLGYKFLVPNSGEICANGAIPYLIHTRDAARAETLGFILQYDYVKVFSFFAALSLLPAVVESVILARARWIREIGVIGISVAVSFVGTLVLFLYAIDWGRWIYIHVISVTLLLFYLDAKSVESGRTEMGRVLPETQWQRLAGAAFLFAYATFWILPTGADKLRFGYVGRVEYLRHYSAKTAGERRDVND
jgi:hypothetical protein